MIGRTCLPVVLSIWLIILVTSSLVEAERWSRQVSSSEWIPLTHPRNQQGHNNNNQNVAPPQLPQIQPLIPGSLPPELRQEYQQQLIQLQKTQESIQRLLLLQQQLKAQQQLLQVQGFTSNGNQENDETKQTQPQLVPEVQAPPQLSDQVRPPVYQSQNFHEPPTETVGQDQYEDYGDRQTEDYRNPERIQGLREKDKYVPDIPSGSANDDQSGDDGEEEVQVVYVPAETLAQRGHAKSHQRGGEKKQYGAQYHQQRPQGNLRANTENAPRQRDKVTAPVTTEDDVYAREFLQQLQREHEGTDRLLKEAREKELKRLREERKEIQRRAKLQQAAVEREQEIQRQREAEEKRKELAKLEEDAKQRELGRIREARERQRLEEIERSKKAQARVNEEKRKQEEARQAEIQRLATLERQKKAEIERTIAAQKELERIQKEDAERASEVTNEAARNHYSRHKETSRNRHDDSEVSPQAQPLLRNQHVHQQHQGQSGKYSRHGRVRSKPRQRLHGQNNEHTTRINQETTTIAPPSPNQPPLAVYMSNLSGDTQLIRITDVLKNLKDAKTIDVLDNVGQDAPQVFVGPSSLEVPTIYAKFDLPYLSSIDNNRVERRVDKLPFFVAPLSFNPPPGYSKIPFPAPHIGSVVINTLDSNIPPDNSDEVNKSNLNPLIEPNSFSDHSNKAISYSTNYDSSTTPTFTNYRQEEPSSTPHYQSSSSYSTVEASGPGQTYRFRQSYGGERPSGGDTRQQSQLNYHEQSQPRPTYQEDTSSIRNNAAQYSEEPTGPTTSSFRRPNVVTSFDYQESPQPAVSSTPIYQDNYSHVRDDTSIGLVHSQPSSADRDLAQHREVVNRYHLPDHRNNERNQEYSSGHVDGNSANRYEDSSRGPTQYNLPAELPPIHPQLPGLVNSLLDEGEQAAFVNRPTAVPSTTIPTTTTTTTTTTERPRTTQKSRGRHRGRVVATRPSTTTTTPSPSVKSQDNNDKTRRPFGRTRSRYTTTTEEYRDTYEPTRSKVTATTQRHNVQENYRRPATTRTQKLKNRDSETSTHSTRNQVHDVQAHEAVNDRSPTLDSNSQQLVNTGVDAIDSIYSQYNFATATTSPENYPIPESIQNTGSDVDFSKTSNYPEVRSSTPSYLQNQDDRTSQNYREHYPSLEFSQTSLENAPVNGFNYQTRTEQSETTPSIPPTSRDFIYYTNKQTSFDHSQNPLIPTDTPVNSQINNYPRPGVYGNVDDANHFTNNNDPRPKQRVPIDQEQISGFGASADGFFDPYSLDNQDAFRSTQLLPEQTPIQITTETPTTTTTTEASSLIIRQKVRGRLGVRNRPDAQIQTRPRGSQDEYVRFSAINNHDDAPTTERPVSRHRENPRTRSKTRPQYNAVQVQTEGNDYVRIQAPIRTYQKTIVTPPSTTPRTVTTPATTTASVAYDTSNDELEYGFIRPPNFSPVHPPENRYHDSYRPNDNQAHLQSIVPTDETAADSILSPAQVSRNRSKYQSPGRRPTSKVASSTTLNSDISLYTERPRNRVEEPKNNRIRVRGRKPTRKRTTTTTTATTEYISEENNNLPLGENYPHPVPTAEDLGSDNQAFYEQKFEALPLASGGTRSPIQQQHRENSYSNQDFITNFGSELDPIPSAESDQTHLASQSPRKYGQPEGTRSKTHSSNQDSEVRDIYGSESQWSTKLTSSSFQPSPSANKLTENDRKATRLSENEKNIYSNDEASSDEPEIITAPPEESYVTMMVSSDYQTEKSAGSSHDSSLEASLMEGTNYGMKTSVGSQTTFEGTTPASISQETFLPSTSISMSSATDATSISEASQYGEVIRHNKPTRKAGGRRRRVRVRVRPAPSEDFVTAESQHFNSAMNNLLQDRLKYRRRDGARGAKATTRSTHYDQHVTTEIPEKTMLEDFLEEVFKTDNASSTKNDTMTNSTNSNQFQIASEQSKVTSGESEVTTTESNKSEVTPTILNESELVTTNPNQFESATINPNQSESATIGPDQSEVVPTSPNQSEVIRILENSTDVFPNGETTMYFTEQSAIDTIATDDHTTNTPLMTTMTIPRKSWDSTKHYAVATSSDESILLTNENQENSNLDDNNANEGNEVFGTDYREHTIKNDDNSLIGKNEEENYPKNHRTEWSEVRYPVDRESYNYNRRSNLTTTQLPGIVTKSDGDTSVKTLSDYVKAIFDTMKSADETKNPQHDVSTSVSSSSSSSSPSRDEDIHNENMEKSETTISSSYDDLTTTNEKSEHSMEKSSMNSTEDTKYDVETKIHGNRENFIASESEEIPKLTDNVGNVETTRYVEETTQFSTDANIVDSSTTLESVDSIKPKINDIQMVKNENTDIVKSLNHSKLGAVLRTSTTTKVSHMTEICYRGRCVMTKPRTEINAR